MNFFNFSEMPFSITPDPRFFFFSHQHREAFDHLIYGIAERKGFIQLTGDVGSGKTTLCRAVLAHLGNQVETALVLNPSLSGTQLLRSILMDFGLPDPSKDRFECIVALNAMLIEKYRAGRNVALLIDEAQNLSISMLENIRLLSNLETDEHKLIQIVMSGQPELRNMLDRKELRQLRQRITVRYHISPLTLDDAVAYIRYRLSIVSKGACPVFSTEAVRRVHEYSGGTPRLINAVCDHALLAGYVAETCFIDSDCVRKAIEQLEGVA